MKTSPPFLHITSKDSATKAIREDKLVKEGSEYIIYTRLPTDSEFKKVSSHGLLSHALNDANINVKRTNVTIDTALKLRNIKNLILNNWIDWDKDHGQTVLINKKSYFKLLNPLNFPEKGFSGTTPDDNLGDPICKMLKSIFVEEKNTREYIETKKEIVKALKSKGYISYTGDSRDLGGLNCTGMSVIYKVPYTKRGNLEHFKGKTIRVCCLGSGERALRECMAGPIEINPCPPNKAHDPSFAGFLAELKANKNIPEKLQVHINNRDASKTKEYLKTNSLNQENINAMESSDICLKLAKEGNIEILNILKDAGISLACPIANIEETKEPNPSRYWHNLLWEIQTHHPEKVKTFITLYNSREFKDLVNSREDQLLKNINHIILTEKQRRLKKNLGEFSKNTIEI